MNLLDFPRPPEDNGMGIHWGNCSNRSFDRYWPLFESLKFKWVVLASESEEDIGYLARRFKEHGVMPIARPQRPINQLADFAHFTRVCNSPYVQIYNEPENYREWEGHRPRGWWEFFKGKWITQAHRVRSEGCYPGLQVTSPEDLKDMLTTLAFEEGDLVDSIWLSLHLYPHKGCPPTCTEHEDDILGFLRYAEICEDIIGFVPPIIVTEGGWTDGQGTPEDRAGWMLEVYEWFQYGRIDFFDKYGVGDIRLPDYLFAICPWILFGKMWHGFSWADNIAHQPMAEAVKSMPSFVRPGEPQPPPQKNWLAVVKNIWAAMKRLMSSS